MPNVKLDELGHWMYVQSFEGLREALAVGFNMSDEWEKAFKGESMPNVDKKDENNCGPTHSFACACREAAMKELDELYQKIMSHMAAHPMTVSLMGIPPNPQRLQELRKQLWGEQNER